MSRNVAAAAGSASSIATEVDGTSQAFQDNQGVAESTRDAMASLNNRSTEVTSLVAQFAL